MNIARKLELAKAALASIIDHDDSPLEEVAAALVELDAYIGATTVVAQARRAAKETKQ
jgi:hypothetical protein